MIVDERVFLCQSLTLDDRTLGDLTLTGHSY